MAPIVKSASDSHCDFTMLEQMVPRDCRTMHLSKPALEHATLPIDSQWADLAVSFDLLGLEWLSLFSSDFVDRVRSWIDAGWADRFYFLHKPPGLRIRFRVRCEQLLPEVERFLDEKATQNCLEAWHHRFYETESYRFGGETGMDIAHEFFTAESLAVLGYLRICLQGNTRLSRQQFSLRLLLELFERVVEGRWELWDIWCKMQLVERVATVSPEVLAAARLEAERSGSPIALLLRNRDELLATASADERELLERYRPEADHIAGRLRWAREHGKLLYGLRSILPSWVVFHWNRMGFSIAEQRSMCLIMIHLLGPDELQHP